jgi:hypothetical protein
VIISIKISCFVFNRSGLSLFGGDNKDKKYYNEGNIPSMAIVLSQLFHYSILP